MNKRFALLLILVLTASSLIVVKPVYSPITKPSVPEFTLKIVDSSYDVPTTYSIDPYTGENVTHPGYHVEKKTIQATIKNNLGASYYNFRYKPHYIDEWSYYPFDPDSSRGYNLYDAYSVPCQADSDSDYTVISMTSLPMHAFPEGGQVDFQVQALFGNFDAIPYGHVQPLPAPTYDFIFTGTTSDWSETQTLTIDTTPPTIYVLSPKNKTYTVNHVSLTLNVSELTSWVGYSLDGQAKVTVTGNITLSDLSLGEHSLTVYANDTFGNTGTSETIYFRIELFPTTWVAAAIVIIAVVAAALLVYFVKVRKTTGEEENVTPEGVL